MNYFIQIVIFIQQVLTHTRKSTIINNENQSAKKIEDERTKRMNESKKIFSIYFDFLFIQCGFSISDEITWGLFRPKIEK